VTGDSLAPVVLASASPRRRELLTALGVPFEVDAANVDESSDEPDAARLAEGLALRKARVVAERRPDAPVLAADTIVVLDGRVLGKPASDAEAIAMLEALRGRDHEVITGVAVRRGERVAADHARTAVRMRAYSDDEVTRYVERGEPFDKAGGYAIQDPDFRPGSVSGCECSVIGLPLWTTRRLLRAAAGLEVATPALERCGRCPLAETPR